MSPGARRERCSDRPTCAAGIEALLEPRHVRELQRDIERRRAAERRSAPDAC